MDNKASTKILRESCIDAYDATSSGYNPQFPFETLKGEFIQHWLGSDASIHTSESIIDHIDANGWPIK